jgi:hypothetical protein
MLSKNPLFQDISGRTFGLWHVIEYAGRRENGKTYWLCKCQCGREQEVAAHALRSGNSSGCSHCRNIKPPKCVKHGHAVRINGRETPEYRTWQNMVQRCTNPKNASYHLYGGRGITICSRWTDPEAGFRNFLADMGHRPPKTSIERIDGSLGYTPSNCKWAAQKEQARNINRNHKITFMGVTRCLSEWSELLNFNRETLRGRLQRGWTVEAALTTPALRR